MSETKSSRASTGNSGPRRRRRNSSNFGKNILPKDDAATGDPPADDQSPSLDDSEPLSLAEEIARTVLGEFGVKRLMVRVTKPGAVANARGVGVEIERP